MEYCSPSSSERPLMVSSCCASSALSALGTASLVHAREVLVTGALHLQIGVAALQTLQARVVAVAPLRLGRAGLTKSDLQVASRSPAGILVLLVDVGSWSDVGASAMRTVTTAWAHE